MDQVLPDPAAFFHVRVIVGVVTGLAIARVLNGLAHFVQAPERKRAYGVHVAWSLLLLLMIMHFWWFEFTLERLDRWTFEAYAFLIFYAALYFFTAAVLFPDRLDGYDDFKAYFYDRRSWFFSLLIILSVVDLVDTALKGMDHFQSLGIAYPIRQGVLILLALIAIPIANSRYHVAFVAFAWATQVWWIADRYISLS
ncbi:hypothetical protein [Halochromatium sp.]